MEIVEYGLLKASDIAAFIISPPNDISDFQIFAILLMYWLWDVQNNAEFLGNPCTFHNS